MSNLEEAKVVEPPAPVGEDAISSDPDIELQDSAGQRVVKCPKALNEDEPWIRGKREPTLAFDAFRVFMSLPEKHRTIPNTASHLNKEKHGESASARHKKVQQWFLTWHWEYRIKRYDECNQKIAEKAYSALSSEKPAEAQIIVNKMTIENREDYRDRVNNIMTRLFDLAEREISFIETKRPGTVGIEGVNKVLRTIQGFARGNGYEAPKQTFNFNIGPEELKELADKYGISVEMAKGFYQQQMRRKLEAGERKRLEGAN